MWFAFCSVVCASRGGRLCWWFSSCYGGNGSNEDGAMQASAVAGKAENGANTFLEKKSKKYCSLAGVPQVADRPAGHISRIVVPSAVCCCFGRKCSCKCLQYVISSGLLDANFPYWWSYLDASHLWPTPLWIRRQVPVDSSRFNCFAGGMQRNTADLSIVWREVGLEIVRERSDDRE